MEIIFLLAFVAWIVYMFLTREKPQPASDHSKQPQSAESQSPYKYFHEHQKTLIGIDLDNRRVLLQGFFGAEQHRKEYSFADIRSWRTNVQKPGRFVGGGLQGGAANALERSDAYRASGLFLEVRDIDFPEWQIVFSHKTMHQDLNRWAEIMRQTVDGS